MPKPEGPQFEQLRMLMTAKELKDSIADSGDRLYTEDYTEHGFPARETMDNLWERKLEESKAERSEKHHGSGVYEGLSDGGLQLTKVPVWTGPGKPKRLQDAHHRLAAQVDIDEKTGKDTWVTPEYSGDSGFAQPERPPQPRTGNSRRFI